MSPGDRVTVGDVFGRLTVIEEVRPHRFRCTCECGGSREASRGYLLDKRVTSCGCAFRALRQSHGLRGTRTWQSWRALRQRCDLKTKSQYADYGGRGITYDPRWREFKNFVDDMGVAPEGRTIDRKDVDGNYTRSNCRWATPAEQAANKRSTKTKADPGYDKRAYSDDPDYEDTF